MPHPLPSNERAFKAFHIAKHKLQINPFTGQIMGFLWSAVIDTLKEHDLWDVEINRKLTICENQIRAVAARAAEQRKAEGK
jgi:hypothetical protein